MNKLIVLAWLLTAATPGDRWPSFRGSGDSCSDAKHLPLAWNSEEGVAWTSDLPGYGQSSPVVWRDLVVITSADGTRKEQAIVAGFDLQSGKLRWKQSFAACRPAAVSNYISRAAPTPVIDANRVYAFFETGNLVALDHAGRILWQRELPTEYGEFRSGHGLGASLAQTDTAVIVLVCHDGPSYTLSVDKATGETLWKAERPAAVSWSSPIVDLSSDPPRILISSSGTCESLAADTGRQLWSVDGLQGNTVPSATVTRDLVFVGSSETGSNLAIRRGGSGDVSDSHIAWQADKATATFSSALVYRDHVYLVNRAGVAFCLDVTSGDTVWTQRIEDSCWASPLGGEDRVYFFGKTGRTTVVAAGDKLKVLAENRWPTDSRVYGVAAMDGCFVFRTGSQLVCVGTPENYEDQSPMNEPEQGAEADSKSAFPDAPQAVTSFGAAVLGDWLYTYGGYFGTPHEYSQAGQSGDLRRLNLTEPKAWEAVGQGPKLTGLALVAHGGKLYRIGGFTARNQKGDDQDLWSSDAVACFDPDNGMWTELPPLPAGRSSFDAAVCGDSIYVVGGWTMQGSRDAVWQEDAFRLDLAAEDPQWRPLAKPAFQRRALSLAALDGRVYAVGGMQPDGDATTKVAVYDPASDVWSEGPALPGEGMEGFGSDCVVAGGKLYVSTISGKLLCLAIDGQGWIEVKTLSPARFFHRLVPLDARRLLILGGAGMRSGKFASVQVIDVEEAFR